MSEEELISRLQEGDWDAFELLLERYRTVLVRTAYLVTRDHESVQDVMQETLIQIWRDLPSFRPYGSFKGWALKILVNKARKHYRRKRVETVALEAAEGVPGSDQAPQEAAEREEEAQTMRLGLERLSTDHREVLVLRYYSELTVPEIARSLNLREGTVKSRISRALGRLQKEFSDADFPGLGGE